MPDMPGSHLRSFLKADRIKVCDVKPNSIQQGKEWNPELTDWLPVGGKAVAQHSSGLPAWTLGLKPAELRKHWGGRQSEVRCGAGREGSEDLGRPFGGKEHAPLCT